jgi:phosphomannomutase
MKTYLFDVDGTLTFPRKKMTSEFELAFLSWMGDKKVYIVAGSDKEKINEQIPDSVIQKLEGIFCCMGNEFWQKEKIIYQNEFHPPESLKELLVSHQMYGGFPVRVKRGGRGSIFEFRTGMLNFTTIGRNACTEERNKYYEWDKKHKERKIIAKEIENKFPELEVRLGGQISIDIQPKGFNKSQASKWIRKNIGGNMYFFGDKCFKGGNDYDISQDIALHQDGEVFSVRDPNQTMQFLKLF